MTNKLLRLGDGGSGPSARQAGPRAVGPVRGLRRDRQAGADFRRAGRDRHHGLAANRHRAGRAVARRDWPVAGGHVGAFVANLLSAHPGLGGRAGRGRQHPRGGGCDASLCAGPASTGGWPASSTCCCSSASPPWVAPPSARASAWAPPVWRTSRRPRNAGGFFAVWWVGDALGDLLIAPLILAFADRPELSRRPLRWLEVAALAAARRGRGFHRLSPPGGVGSAARRSRAARTCWRPC